MDTPRTTAMFVYIMAETKITIEKLAAMINKGFKSTASKEDINAVADELTTRLDSIETRLGRIENLQLAEQKPEIADLQKRMQRLEDALAV
jgi:hypothetical protein